MWIFTEPRTRVHLYRADNCNRNAVLYLHRLQLFNTEVFIFFNIRNVNVSMPNALKHHVGK